MLDATRPLLLVGGGKMGEALLAGWLGQGLSPDAVVVVEPDQDRCRQLAAAHGVGAAADVAAVPGSPAPGAVLLAVKPQLMDGVLPGVRPLVATDTLVLSIAAGKPIAVFEQALGENLAVVRAMPNTPAAVGRGVTVLCANPHAGAEQRALAERLMAAVGQVHWIDDEDLMHAVTAVSGSGPAYVFYLIEALAAAGVEAGLPAPLAMDLARGTVIGAGELARRSVDSAAQLRVNVTSPGGTTAAALAVLAGKAGIGPVLVEAVAAAARRSRELA